MKKTFNIVLLMILLLHVVSGFLGSSKVIAESLGEPPKRIELINQDKLKISYTVIENKNSYTWNISYQFADTKDDSKLSLKFQFDHDQAIEIEQARNFTVKDDSVESLKFLKTDNGNLKISSGKSISKLLVKLELSSQVVNEGHDSITPNILSDSESKAKDLLQFKKELQDTKAPSVSSEQSISKSTVSKSVGKATQNEPSNSNLLAESKATTATSNNFVVNNLLTSTQYTNVSPSYADDNGSYPLPSWTPSGNTTVINHQGRTYGSNNWDGVKSWNGDPGNKTNSYIEYGAAGANADFAIRKYARETTTKGLYDVYLNVRGNEQKTIKPVDIVLVVDMSGSMEPSNNSTNSDRAGAVRSGVENFLKSIQNAGIGKYVNVGVVGFSSPGEGATGKAGYFTIPINNLENSSQITTINQKLQTTFYGGTFTQLGIRKGAEMLKNDTSSNPKTMILLTDGVPTFSYAVKESQKINGVVYGTQFETDRIDSPGNTSQFNNYWSPSPYYASGNLIKDTWAATLGESNIIKQNIEIRALGIQLGMDGGVNGYQQPYLTQSQVRDKMKLLASPNLYQDADSVSQVQKYLEDQAKDVVSSFNTVVNGSISDPLGSQFKYKDTKVEVTSVGGTQLTNLPSAQMSENQINVSNINLGKGQELQFHYQVQLNTETSDFVPEKWYQMNGRTTFTPNSNSPNNKVDFAIPSAKGEGTQLNLKKIWEEYDGDKSGRPQKVTFEIKRSDTTLNSTWTSGFIDVSGTNDTDTWQKNNVTQLSAKAGDPQTLWLPKYNTNGQTFTYSIKSESRVPGYTATALDETTYKNSKQFVPFTLKINKTDDNGRGLAGAQFKLTDSNGKEIIGSIDASGVLFTYQNLIAGQYSLTEVKAPSGYVLLKNSILITVLPNGKVEIDGKAFVSNNHTIALNIKNHQIGTLPTTGGNGPIVYWIVGSALLILFIIVGAYYLLIIRKN